MNRTFITVDTGGTFTDLVAYDPQARTVRFTKSLTTHADPVEGIFTCVHKTGLQPAQAAIFKVGTTLVINALIERTGPATALVTTTGFRDVLELARGNRVEPFDLFYRRSPALVDRTARLEVNERVAGDGTVLQAPSREQVEAIAGRLRESGVEAVGISFINAYLQPANERQVAGWLREMLPDVFVTCGSELSREWYEYERTSTVAANAYVGPLMSRYVRSIERALAEHSFGGQLLLMGSAGGAVSPRRAASASVSLVESGPIGGCIGASVYAHALGMRNLIAFDMGGTTAKAAVIDDGNFDVVSTYYVGGYGKGIPIRTPVADIVEIGAGGGSIAWTDAQQRLHVGPQSSGSSPGPACYGRGGEQPTVTDANLVLGRLNPARFQGGEMPLDESSARAALARLGEPLGYQGEQGVLDLANGILSIAAVAMGGVVKRLTVERGRDPRDFALFAYGGGGPLHCVELARELGIGRVIVPPHAGNFAALGMLLADVRRDNARTFLHRLDDQPAREAEAVFGEMEQELTEALRTDFGDVPIRTERHLEMRYVGQMHTVRIGWAAGNGPSLDPLVADFSADYERRFGHLIPNGAVEIVSLHVAAFASVPRPALQELFQETEGPGEISLESRMVCFPGERRKRKAQVFRREQLRTGFVGHGPAVIEEYGSTVLVGPDDSFEVGRLGELHVHVASGGQQAQETQAMPDTIDPVSLEVILQTIQSIPDLVETDLTRTAFSPLIYEYKDYAVGLVDAQGSIIALARHGLPLFTASLIGRSVLDGIALHGADGIRAGDVLLTNHAGTIGQHLNNVVMYTPVFGRGPRPVAFMAVIAHWIDIGGRYPGSCSGTDTTELAQEGLQLRSVKLVNRGEIVGDIYRVIEHNTRLPEMLLGDVAAQLAGCVKGRDLFEALMARQGEDRVFGAIRANWAVSMRAAHAAVAAVADGTYFKSGFLDDDGVELGKRIALDVKVHVRGDRFTVDYSGIGAQLRGPYNSGYFGGGETCARIAFKYLFSPHEPANEGGFAPLHLELPAGKFLSAGPGAPVAKYSAPLPSVIDTIIAAVAPALPDRVAGGHHASFGVYSLSGMHPRTGRYFNYFDTAHGGFGGSVHGDGVGPYKSLGHSDNKDIPVEVQEALYPIRVERHEWRPDSAGAGQFRGGMGVRKSFLALGPMKANISFERFSCPPWGVFGGGDALPGHVELEPVDGPARRLQKASGVVLSAGDRFHVLSGGGGGYGPPQARAADAVAADVARGLVSPEAAERAYGVVLKENAEVDTVATLALRPG